MNILFLNKFNDRWKEKFHMLKEEFPHVEFTATFNPAERSDVIKNADAIVSGRLTPEEIEQADKLKVIFVPFTGLNTFPINIIKQKGIIISNTHANAKYVAERAVTLALALLGRVAEFHHDLKHGKWNRSIEGEDMWETIQGKSVGILGLGNIGTHIARFVKPYGCTVYGFNRSGINPGPLAINEVSTNLLHVIEKSEIIFVTLPLNSETKNILNDEIFAKMQGKYLINVGRGETISEDAAYKALKDGILKGAALDVWYIYPGKKTVPVYPAKKPFWEMPNVLLSPHKSSHTAEAIKAMIDDTCENIRSFIIDGKPKQTAKLE
jgi:phosphoglycerate dehydrogenase-like enzyme